MLSFYEEYPIYITLPPHEISSFIQNLSDNFKERNQDFVFFAGGPSYGNIEDDLKGFGYCRDSMTQVLITGLKITPMKTVQDIQDLLRQKPMTKKALLRRLYRGLAHGEQQFTEAIRILTMSGTVTMDAKGKGTATNPLYSLNPKKGGDACDYPMGSSTDKDNGSG